MAGETVDGEGGVVVYLLVMDEFVVILVYADCLGETDTQAQGVLGLLEVGQTVGVAASVETGQTDDDRGLERF